MSETPRSNLYVDLPAPTDITVLDDDVEELTGTDEAMDEAAEAQEDDAIDGVDTTVEDTLAQISFLDHLQTPIITLIVGTPPSTTSIAAHQSLLAKSPFFSEQFTTTPSTTSVALPSETLDSVGCFVQYLYTGDYFPKLIDGHSLERDPAMPELDEEGDHLLKHARVYILADKFGMAELKTLAHKKIHKINSSAKGEIAYARFVYAKTPKEDRTIRGPVAAFWSAKAYILRHEAEEEFRKMILEFPQFGYDVISLLLDQKEKTVQHPTATTGSARKRARTSNIGA